MEGSMKEIMTVQEAADYLRVSYRTVLSLLYEGLLGHYEVGVSNRSIRIGRQHIQQYLESRETNPHDNDQERVNEPEKSEENFG